MTIYIYIYHTYHLIWFKMVMYYHLIALLHGSVGDFDESGWHLNKSADLHHQKGWVGMSGVRIGSMNHTGIYW